MADRFKAMLPGTFLFDAADEALHEAVLLRAVRCDEFLLQAIGPDRGGVTPRGEDQTMSLSGILCL